MERKLFTIDHSPFTIYPLCAIPKNNQEWYEMPKVEAQTAQGEKSFETDEGKKLVLAIEDAGIDILHRCGGNAKCTTCRVEVLAGDPGEIGEAERNRLAMETGLAENVRLSCQVRVHDDLKVRVINQSSTRNLPPGPRPVED